MFQLRPLPRTLNAALRDVEDPKVSVRKSALLDLSRLAHGDDRAVALTALAERLVKDDAAEVRSAAALALADAQARGDIEALLAARDDAHAVVRQMVVLALGELAPRGHREARDVIERALSDSEGALRFQALLAASKLFPEDLDDRLETAVTDSDGRVRYLALRVLDERLAESDRTLSEVSK
jgi:HEAT repeat protein